MEWTYFWMVLLQVGFVIFVLRLILTYRYYLSFPNHEALSWQDVRKNTVSYREFKSVGMEKFFLPPAPDESPRAARLRVAANLLAVGLCIWLIGSLIWTFLFG